MVGMVIGMLGIIVMMQVFLVSDASRRTTGGAGDAQTNGTSALYALQRDIRQAGYGITSLDLVGCDILLRTGVTLTAMAPLTINHASIPAGDANTDTLLVVYANSAGTPEGDVIVLQPATTTYAVTAPTSFAVGDFIIAEPANRPVNCSLTMEPVLTRTASPPNLTVAVGVAAIANGTLFNMGPAPRILAYAIRGGNLTVCDYQAADCADADLATDASVWTPLVNDILSMRVEYGRDTTAAMDGIVDVWDQITPGSAADTSGLSLPCSISRVQAARLVLVARSGSFEKEAVTTAAPTWNGSAGAPINLSANPDGTAYADWQQFRYKLFQTVAPLRNVVSLGVQTGC